jgi:hypothetical protein|uniref:Uncharacterized protein n=1 Tax=viral metagenome TaxID=1070528 RepID=A0A6C0D1V8_9ZZZZ
MNCIVESEKDEIKKLKAHLEIANKNLLILKQENFKLKLNNFKLKMENEKLQKLLYDKY